MKTMPHIISFSFKNIICKDDRTTTILHSVSKAGLSIVCALNSN